MRKPWHYILKILLTFGTALMLAANGVCAAAASPAVEVHGVVVAGAEKTPLEAAYVVLVYANKAKVKLIDGRCPECWCVRTRGGYTDKNGKFSFPPEVLHDDQLTYVAAIKPNYYSASRNYAFSSSAAVNSELTLSLLARNPGDRANFSLRDRLDDDRMLLHSHRLDCWRAKTRADAGAAIPFLEILMKDDAAHAKDIGRAIYLMKSLPSGEPKER